MATNQHFLRAFLVLPLATACTIRSNASPEAAPQPREQAIAPTPHHGDHGMDLGPADASYDLRFLDAMILHHISAVTMAESALNASGRSPLKNLAQEIIAAQQQEIDQMQQWRRQWYPNAPKETMAWHRDMNHTMPMTPVQERAMRMDRDLGTADATYDLRFIESMIVHHEGALVMAADARQKSKRPEVQKLAGTIIRSQRQEIAQMQQWRQHWYGKQ
jgi:uncharacterized protein (DUF305 family)